jgi:hypothetical protein
MDSCWIAWADPFVSTYPPTQQGIEEAVKAMKVGDRWKLQIPGPSALI